MDWQKVLRYTANGVTQDYAMQLATNRTSTLLLRIQRNTTAGADNARWRIAVLARSWLRLASETRRPLSGGPLTIFFRG